MASKDNSMAISFIRLVKMTFAEHSEEYADFLELMFNDTSGSTETIALANKLFKGHPSLLKNYFELPKENLNIAREALQGSVVVRSRPIGGQKITSTVGSPEERLGDAFGVIFRSKAKYKLLLGLRGERAQSILDALQMLTDYHQDSLCLKGDILQALIRLSKISGLYPQCFALQGVKQTGLAVAAGHFGEVWKGDFQGTSVCLKVVKAYQNSHIEKLLQAYSKEAILWSQLSHSNLLPFYGIYHLSDEYRRICLVSPWMENGNVVEYIQNVPSANRLLLLNDISQGISYIHKQNIVHGDLKGANILVTSSGRACLGDFGLSSVSDPEVIKWTSLQSTANAGGTIRWQAPELVDPEAETIHIAKESDVYAFGCVCYELFTGNVPFYEILREATVTLRISRGEKPSKPDLESRDPDSMFYRGLTEDMWDLMQQCWKREPTERPSIEEVLDRFLTDPTDPRPTQNWDELTSARFRRAMRDSFSPFLTSEMERTIKLLREL